MFAAPNTTAIMNSVPAEQRGAASGMRATFQNSASIVSIGVFFSIVTGGLASALPGTLSSGLLQAGVPGIVAHKIAGLPPTAAWFAAFLGYKSDGDITPRQCFACATGGKSSQFAGQELLPEPDIVALHAWTARRFLPFGCVVSDSSLRFIPPWQTLHTARGSPGEYPDGDTNSGTLKVGTDLSSPPSDPTRSGWRTR